MASGRLARRLLDGGGAGWRRRIARDLLATALTTVVTAPIVAWTFGRLSLAAPATNLLAAPLFGLAQPALFLSLALAPAAPLAQLLADGAGLLLDAIEGVASLGAAVPYGAVAVSPHPLTAILLAVVGAATVVACASRHYGRAAGVALAALAAAVWHPLLPSLAAPVELHVLDVGQGDAVALRTPHGAWVVVDAGGVSARGDAGERTVAPFLRKHGGRVALLVLTHPHADHVGGAASLIERVGADTVLDAARVFGTSSYEETLRAARRRGSVWRRVRPGEEHVVDGVSITVLAPDSTWTATRDDPNTSSVVVRATYGNVRFLLTGDAEADEEGWLTARHAEGLRADVLKVGHHGSRTSSTDAFLDAVRPRVALISVGRGNRYGHPDEGVLRRFDERSVEVLRTDDDGTITVQSDGRSIWLRARGSFWKLRD
jgi:competence protein ComEC